MKSWESQKLCGGDRDGCCDSELAVFVSKCYMIVTVYEHSPLDASIEVKKGGYIQSAESCLKCSFPPVALLLSLSGTLSPLRISIVSISTTSHSLSPK